MVIGQTVVVTGIVDVITVVEPVGQSGTSGGQLVMVMVEVV